MSTFPGTPIIIDTDGDTYIGGTTPIRPLTDAEKALISPSTMGFGGAWFYYTPLADGELTVDTGTNSPDGTGFCFFLTTPAPGHSSGPFPAATDITELHSLAGVAASFGPFPVRADSTYYFMTVADSATNHVDDSPMTVSPIFTGAASSYFGPTIILDPWDHTVNEGATATFTTEATGRPVPTLQWQKQVPGAGTGGDGRHFDSAGVVAIAHNGGSYTTPSTPATALSIDEQARVVSGGLGLPGDTYGSLTWWSYLPLSSGTLTIDFVTNSVAAGGGNVAYHGYSSLEAGSTLETLTATGGGAIHAGEPYSLSVSANTQYYILTYDYGPADMVGVFTGPASSGTASYWSDISGATSSPLTFTAALADDQSKYRAVWTSSRGTATSAVATLTIGDLADPSYDPGSLDNWHDAPIPTTDAGADTSSGTATVLELVRQFSAETRQCVRIVDDHTIEIVNLGDPVPLGMSSSDAPDMYHSVTRTAQAGDKTLSLEEENLVLSATATIQDNDVRILMSDWKLPNALPVYGLSHAAVSRITHNFAPDGYTATADFVWPVPLTVVRRGSRL